ncbi:MAG: hypothetical protein WCX79_01415 [Candidatus Paceibacterota bacterium]|jgi:hypothetical protein
MREHFKIHNGGNISELKDNLVEREHIDHIKGLIYEKSSLLKEALESIDYKLLKRIFINRIKKYVKDFKGENFKTGLLIGEIKGKEAPLGLYNIYTKNILINTNKILDQSLNNKLFKLSVLRVACHEETHALSHQKHVRIEENNLFMERIKTGFRVDYFIANKVEDGNDTLCSSNEMNCIDFLNEAVTEKFAEEIFTEYIKYQFLDKKLLEIIKNQSYYDLNIEYLDYLILQIAEKTNFSPHYVKEAFFCSMFKGDDFTDDSFTDAIDEIMGKNFSKKFFVRKRENSQ